MLVAQELYCTTVCLGIILKGCRIPILAEMDVGHAELEEILDTDILMFDLIVCYLPDLERIVELFYLFIEGTKPKQYHSWKLSCFTQDELKEHFDNVGNFFEMLET